ncbi:MAG: hypothetical protein V2A73_03980 [Pseudomonadota bacterium]
MKKNGLTTRFALTLAPSLALALALALTASCQRPSNDGAPVPAEQGSAIPSGIAAGDQVAVARYPLGSLNWSQKDVIEPSTIAASSYFGQALDLDEDTLIVGATEWTGDQPYFGAEVFVWNGTEWSHEDTLEAELKSTMANYAWDVAISGDIAAVGAPNEIDDEGTSTGAVFLFKRTLQGSWTFLQKVISSHAKAACWFGSSVALDGDTLLVGMSNWYDVPQKLGVGSAHIFARNHQTGLFEERDRLVAGDGGTMHEFGYTVDLQGYAAVVGAPGGTADAADGEVKHAGAAYVFDYNGTSWIRIEKLQASEPAEYARCGGSVAVDWDNLIVGCRGQPAGEDSEAYGAAYVFALSDAQDWRLEQMLVAASGYTGTGFGESVAIRGSLAAVGAPDYGGTDGVKEGAVYVFARSSARQWAQIAELQAAGTVSDDEFGSSMVLDSSLLVVGAKRFDVNEVSDTGAAFGFDFVRLQGTPCDYADQCSTGFCTDGICCNEACGDGDTSDCRACSTERGASEDGTCTLTTTMCRPAREDAPCDAPERCDGTSVTCPADANADASVECRPAGDDCDAPEYCTLGTDQCPDDLEAENGATCENPVSCREGGFCIYGECMVGRFVLSFTPDQFPLSIHSVDGPATGSLTIAHTGTLDTVTLTGAEVSPTEAFELSAPTTWPVDIAPGASVDLQVRFTPAGAGTTEGRLTIFIADCGDLTEIRLPLAGIVGAVDASPADSDFGTDATSPSVDAAGGVDDAAGGADGAATADATTVSDVDAAVPGVDGNVSGDSVPSGEVDAGSPDATNTGESSDTGCGCRVGQAAQLPFGARASTGAVSLLLLLGMLASRRRPRR